MMIRGDWRDFRDDPPTSGPYFLAVAVLWSPGWSF